MTDWGKRKQAVQKALYDIMAPILRAPRDRIIHSEVVLLQAGFNPRQSIWPLAHNNVQDDLWEIIHLANRR